MPRLYVTGVNSRGNTLANLHTQPKIHHQDNTNTENKQGEKKKKSSNSTNTLTVVLNKYAELLCELPSAVLLGFLLHSVSTATTGLVRITTVKNKTCEIGHTVSLNNKLPSAWLEQH